MSIRTRKRGKSYSYVFEAGKSADGKRKVIEKGGFKSAEEAYDAGVSAYVDWKHGNIGIISEQITFADMLNLWLEKNSSNVKEKTRILYQKVSECKIIPYLGDIVVQRLTPIILDNWLQARVNEGLSQAYLKLLMSVIKSTLKYAVYPCNLISSSPAEYIKIPRCCPRNIITRKVITPEMFSELLRDHPIGNVYRIPLLISYYTGMRMGEVLGLTWDNIDLVNNVIKATQQLQYIEGKGYTLADLKSYSSYREIPISMKLAEALQDWRMLQDLNSEVRGSAYIVSYFKKDVPFICSASRKIAEAVDKINFVCTDERGKFIHRSSYMLHLKKLGLNSHSFRHSHATLLIEAGAPPKGVAARLGHADVLITQNLYTHETEELRQDTLSYFDKRLENR